MSYIVRPTRSPCFVTKHIKWRVQIFDVNTLRHLLQAPATSCFTSHLRPFSNKLSVFFPQTDKVSRSDKATGSFNYYFRYNWRIISVWFQTFFSENTLLVAFQGCITTRGESKRHAALIADVRTFRNKWLLEAQCRWLETNIYVSTDSTNSSRTLFRTHCHLQLLCPVFLLHMHVLYPTMVIVAPIPFAGIKSVTWVRFWCAEKVTSCRPKQIWRT